MIKTYKLTNAVRNSSFVLRGKTGNSLRYNFSGGDPLTGKPATIILRSQYAQYLLEESDVFKKGFVVLSRTDEGGEKVAATPAAAAPSKTVMEDIVSPEQLLEFVATELEKVYQRPEAALEFAKKRNYEFPNLIIKKEEK